MTQDLEVKSPVAIHASPYAEHGADDGTASNKRLLPSGVGSLG